MSGTLKFKPFVRPQAAPLRGVTMLCGLVFLWLSGMVRGDAAWEISPYRCQVWLLMGPHPALPQTYQRQVLQQVQERLQSSFGGAWELRVESAPLAARWRLRQSPATWHPIDWLTIAPESTMSDLDKLFLVRVDAGGRDFTITSSEVDSASRRMSEVGKSHAVTPEGLAWSIAQRIVGDFTPLASVHRVDGNQVELRCRAADLFTTGHSLARIPQGTYLQPILIPKNPYGQVRIEGIRVIPWTILEVVGTAENRLQAKLYSAFGQPLRARRSRRHEQVARVLKARSSSTTIKLVTREATPRPLVGYELLIAGTDNPPDGTAPLLGPRLGETDEQGEIRVERQQVPSLQQLLVRHGTRVLVRIPLVAGAMPSEILSLQDDDDRLEVEGFVQGVMDHLIDTVAQRQLITLRIRRHMEAGEYPQAQELIEALRKLESRSEFLERVQRRQRMLAGGNREMQTRAIDKLFGETRVLFDNYLDPLLPQRLQDELRARQAADKQQSSGAPQRKEPTEVGSQS